MRSEALPGNATVSKVDVALMKTGSEISLLVMVPLRCERRDDGRCAAGRAGKLNELGGIVLGASSGF